MNRRQIHNQIGVLECDIGTVYSVIGKSLQVPQNELEPVRTVAPGGSGARRSPSQGRSGWYLAMFIFVWQFRIEQDQTPFVSYANRIDEEA